MKKILSILSCFVVSYGFGQNNFIVSVGTPSGDKFVSVIQVADLYIGTGRAAFSDIPIYKLDTAGRLVSNAVITAGNPYTEADAIINTMDGGFAITGLLGSDNVFGFGQMGVLKFDSGGSFQWTKQYDEGAGATGKALLQTDDKGFLIVGTSDYATPSAVGYLVRTDSAGNLQWSKTFVNVEEFRGLQKTKDHNYILLTGAYNDSATSVIKIDTAGNILWSKSFIISANEELRGLGILAVSDGGYLIPGVKSFVKLDSLGNAQWSKRVDADAANYPVLYDAIETGNKSYVLAGGYYLNSGSEGANYYLIKIDSMGTVLWTKGFSERAEGTQMVIQKLIATSDGGYLGAGDEAFDCAFLKFDSAFNICKPAQSLGSFKNFDVSYKNKTISAVTGNAITYTQSVSILDSGSVINTCSVLPVNLIAFNIMQQNEYVLLKWQTASEQNNAFFAIERSNNGNKFKEIGKVNSKGNSNQVQRYSFADFIPFSGGNYYRLRQVDADGKTTYSKVVFIDFSKVIAIALYPNPAKDFLTLQRLNANIKTTISIIGLQGGVLAKTTTISGTCTWNIKQLPPGTYYVRIESDKNVSVLKFVKE